MAADYVHVYTTNGHLEAEMVRLFLESKGVQAVAYGESLGSVYGLTIGTLGEVKIYVPEAQAEDAGQLLADMEQGKYDVTQLQEETPVNDPEPDEDGDDET